MNLNSEQLQLQKKLNNFIDYNKSGTFGVLGQGGTGKTYTICKSIDVNKAIFLGATNKVCANLRENLTQSGYLGFKVKTIDSFFHFKMSKDENNKTVITTKMPSEELIPEILVIDEASLINKRIFDLLQQLREKRKIILIGDDMQIPPIEEREDIKKNAEGFQVSRVFLDLDYQFTLTTQMRQKEGSKMYSFISGFRNNMHLNIDFREKAIKHNNGNDILYVDLNSSKLNDLIYNGNTIAVCYKNLTVLGFNYKSGKVLTGDRNYKVNEVNIGDRVVFDSFYKDDNCVFYTADVVTVIDKQENLIETINIGYDEKVTYAYDLLSIVDNSGTPFIVKKGISYKETTKPFYYRKNKVVSKLRNQINDNNKFKINSEIAKLHTAYFDFQNSFAKLKKPFAISSHKSQGSTFDSVIIPIYDYHSREYKDRNQLFYVAISRAKERLIFVDRSRSNFNPSDVRVYFTEEERCSIASHQDWKCAICYEEVHDREYDLDHKIRLGLKDKDGIRGTNALSNLQVLCKPCHKIKTSNE